MLLNYVMNGKLLDGMRSLALWILVGPGQELLQKHLVGSVDLIFSAGLVHGCSLWWLQAFSGGRC